MGFGLDFGWGLIQGLSRVEALSTLALCCCDFWLVEKPMLWVAVAGSRCQQNLSIVILWYTHSL